MMAILLNWMVLLTTKFIVLSNLTTHVMFDVVDNVQKVPNDMEDAWIQIAT